ncbi:MAG: insulinase family protein, partial [Mediterranea sp.]|nr:insulinase family protein [Mediterranea sp.]
AQVNKDAYTNLAADLIKARRDAKLNQSQNFSRLVNYVTYGSKAPTHNFITDAELQSMDPQTLIDRIHTLNSYKHRILYYGPSTGQQLLDLIAADHRTPETLKEIPAGNELTMLLTPETKVYIAPYDARQIYMAQISNKGDKFDAAIEPTRQLYNEYFGGGMNSIVFQEMRESRGLAYSANARFSAPTYQKDPYYLRTQIATQNDKMMDAIHTFNDIINNMPISDAAFKLAKDGMITRLRTERITKMNVLLEYIYNQYLGYDVDPRIKLYNDAQSLMLDDIIVFQQQWVKGRTYNYAILGDKKDLDMNALSKIGTVVELKTEDIFGY